MERRHVLTEDDFEGGKEYEQDEVVIKITGEKPNGTKAVEIQTILTAELGPEKDGIKRNGVVPFPYLRNWIVKPKIPNLRFPYYSYYRILSNIIEYYQPLNTETDLSTLSKPCKPIYSDNVDCVFRTK